MVVGGRGFSVGGAASGCGMPPPVQVWGVNSYVGPRQWPHSNPHCGLHSMHVQLSLTHWNLPSSLPSCAHPSSCTASSWFLPCRWPGILHMGYSRLHVISLCLCATSTSTSNSTGTHVNSDTTSNDIRMSFCATFWSVWRIQTLTSWWHESLYYQQVGPRSGLDVLKAGKMGNAQWSDWSEGSLEWQGEDCTLLCDIALCAWIGRNGSSVTL